MTTRPIRFIFRGQRQEVAHSPTTRSILQFLREDARCTGTKEGCAEGDCGACTVMIGELDHEQQLHLRAVNACIQLLPTLDGKLLLTIEDLASESGQLHPVQQAMMQTHAAQCGFCTPGFIMSLWGLYLRQEGACSAPTRAQINDTLSGNLCRCTGYRPIIDAAQSMHQYPAVTLDKAALTQQLLSLQDDPPLVYQCEDQLFHAPRTIEQLAQWREQYPEAQILSGSTDIGLWVTRQFRPLPHLMYVGRVDELKKIHAQDGLLRIGAAALLNHAYDALIAYYPELQELRQRFASYPIRNAGTLGGNVANGSPIGDSMPWLLALDAQLLLRKGAQTRQVALADYYLAYQKTALQKGEFVQEIWVPTQRDSWVFRTYKLAKRHDQDISAVCAAFSLQLEQGRILAARVAFGGMAATPSRAQSCEQTLEGKNWTPDTVQLAMQALAQDFQPLSDMRASADYRLLSAQNLLYRFFLETQPDTPLNPAQISVFAQTAQEIQP